MHYFYEWLIEKQNATNHFSLLLLPFQLEYATILLMSLEQRNIQIYIARLFFKKDNPLGEQESFNHL